MAGREDCVPSADSWWLKVVGPCPIMADRTSARGFGTLGSGRRRETRAATTVLDRQPAAREWKATHPNPPGGMPRSGGGNDYQDNHQSHQGGHQRHQKTGSFRVPKTKNSSGVSGVLLASLVVSRFPSPRRRTFPVRSPTGIRPRRCVRRGPRNSAERRGRGQNTGHTEEHEEHTKDDRKFLI